MSGNHPVLPEAADAAFERMLIDSARGDGVSDAAAREAWARFALATGAVAAVGAGTGLIGITRRAAVPWLVLGALGGGAITAAWMHDESAQPHPAPAVMIAPTTNHEKEPAPPEAVAAEAPPALLRTARSLRPAPSRVRPVAVPEKEVVLEPIAAAVASVPAAASSAPPSTLAAEVLALDEIRAAVVAQDFARALAHAESYHREFPRGQLAADADALAIEALEARGDHNQAARGAKQFLGRNPNDPHAARMRALSAR